MTLAETYSQRVKNNNFLEKHQTCTLANLEVTFGAEKKPLGARWIGDPNFEKMGLFVGRRKKAPAGALDRRSQF